MDTTNKRNHCTALLGSPAVTVAIVFTGIQHKTIQGHPLRVERSFWFRLPRYA